MAASAGKYRDTSEDPLTEKERKNISRMTSDPREFHENMKFWLNNEYLQEFPLPPHGAQLEMDADFTNPADGIEVVEWQVVNHDTNSYVLGNTFRIPGINTVKLSGVYTMSVDLTFDATDFGTDAYVGIYRNNVPIAIQTIDSALKTVSLCVVRRLNEGDVIDVRTYKSAGTQTILFDAYIVKPVFNIACNYLLDNFTDDATGPGDPGCVAPVLSVFYTGTPGTWVDGVALTVDVTGTTGDAVLVYTYQWQRDAVGAPVAWTDLAGETAATITPDYAGTDLNANDRLRCYVTVTNDCGSDDGYTIELDMQAD